MPTALEQLGLTPEDVGLGQPQAQQQPAGGALAELGLAPDDVGQPAAPQQEQLGIIESGAQGAAQGLTLGFADELYGIGAGLIPGGQNREEATKTARARLARANPAAALAGELAGSLVIPGGVARTGASLGARALRGAVAGTVTGGIGGAGRAEGSLEERAPAAATGAALGGTLGGAAAAAAPAVSRGVQRLTGGRVAGQPNTLPDDETIDGLMQTLTRGDDVGVKAQDAVRGIQAAATKGKKGVSDAYDKIAKFEGKVEDQASFELLSNKFNRLIEDEGVEYLSGGKRIMDLADRVVGTMEKGATPKDMDSARKLIAKVGRNVSARDPEEARIFQAMKRDFDDWTFDTLTNKLYRGDDAAVDQIKEARGLATEYHKAFGKFTGESGSAERTAGGMISRIIQDDVQAEEAVNLLFGANAIGVKGSRQAIARIRDVAPEAFEQLQGAHFLRLVSGNSGKGDLLSGDQISKRIQKLNSTPLAKTLYGKQLAELNRFGENIKSKPSVGRAVADFVRTRPAIMGAILGGGAGAAGSGGDVGSTTFGALLGTALSRGRGAPAGVNALKKAARPAAQTTRRAGQVGGTLGGLAGPSLAGG